MTLGRMAPRMFPGLRTRPKLSAISSCAPPRMTTNEAGTSDHHCQVSVATVWPFNLNSTNDSFDATMPVRRNSGLKQLQALSRASLVLIRPATNFDKPGPKRRTITKRPTCIAITKPASTALVAAMIATESAPPGLVAR